MSSKLLSHKKVTIPKLPFRANLRMQFLSLFLILNAVNSYGQQNVFSSDGLLSGTTNFIKCSESVPVSCVFKSSLTIQNTVVTNLPTLNPNVTYNQVTNISMRLELVEGLTGGIYNIGTLQPQSGIANVLVAFSMQDGGNGYIYYSYQVAGSSPVSGSIPTTLKQSGYFVRYIRTTSIDKNYVSSSPNPPPSTNETSTTTGNSNTITVKFGIPPVFTINNKSDAQLRLLEGCEPNIVLKVNTTCATDKLILSIREINPFVFTSNGSMQTVGVETADFLTSAERTALIGSTGLNINSFRSFTFTAGKTYGIALIYNGMGLFLPTYKTLQYKSGSYDLVMKDFATDNGFEPSVTAWSTTDPFRSPALINQLSTTTSTNFTNENPDYVTDPNNSNKMRIEVRNIGCAASPANEVPVKTYWTLARTNELWDAHWKFDLTNNGVIGAVSAPLKVPMGSEATIAGASFTDPYGIASGNQLTQPFLLPSIAANGVYTMPTSGIDWFPPNPAEYTPTNSTIQFNGIDPVICYLARIEDANDPIVYAPIGNNTLIKPYVVNNNNVATRNSFLVDGANFVVGRENGSWEAGGGSVVIANPVEPPTSPDVPLPIRNICIDLLPHEHGEGVTFDNYGQVELLLTDGLWEAWEAAGLESSNITIPEGSGPRPITMTGNIGCLHNIALTEGADAMERLAVRFVFSPENLPENPLEFSYRLSVNPTDEFLGQLGESFQDPYTSSNAIFDVIVPNQQPQSFAATALNKVNKTTTVSIYPNPANTQFTLTAQAAITQIEIIDINGRVVFKNKGVQQNTLTLSTQNWVAGFYFAKVITQQGMQVLKLHIQR